MDFNHIYFVRRGFILWKVAVKVTVPGCQCSFFLSANSRSVLCNLQVKTWFRKRKKIFLLTVNSIWDLKLQLVSPASVVMAVKISKWVGVMNVLDWNPARLFSHLLISADLMKGRFLCWVQSAGIFGETEKGSFLVTLYRWNATEDIININFDWVIQSWLVWGHLACHPFREERVYSRRGFILFWRRRCQGLMKTKHL